jgi:hypothetical protein
MEEKSPMIELRIILGIKIYTSFEFHKNCGINLCITRGWYQIGIGILIFLFLSQKKKKWQWDTSYTYLT